ncbi:MAG: SLATT domain-containing protein [Candidatus Binatia bacterium]
METTGEVPVSKTKQEIIREAKRLGESTLYSSKGHLIAARIWSNFHLILGLVMVIITAIAAALAMSAFDEKHIAAGVLYILTAVLSAVLTFLNANERAGSHQNAGNHYDSLMNRVRIFWSIGCWQEDSEPELVSKLQAFSSEKDRLNLGSPQVPYWAYKIAKRQISAGEASFTVDQEKSD